MQQTIKQIVKKAPTKYKSRKVDAQGFVKWEQSENDMWKKLTAIQNPKIEKVACQEHLDGLKLLNMPMDRVPQLPEINEILMRETGWRVAPVPALINFERFFKLLADRQFPCATFLRIPEEMYYLTEPDIFHEIYGHTPLLTNPFFADFTAQYGRLGLTATPKQRVFLARLYWFTVEFGLMVKKNGDKKIYGGGILSSIGETESCLDESKVEIRKLNALDAMRTPYRIDIMQPIYYSIEELSELGKLDDKQLMETVQDAMKLGLFEPTFPPKEQEIIKETTSQTQQI